MLYRGVASRTQCRGSGGSSVGECLSGGWSQAALEGHDSG